MSKNSFEVREKKTTPEIESVSSEIQAGNIKTKVVDAHKQTGKLILTYAENVVSGGRGIKSADNWGSIEELADVHGAATASTRPV